MSYSFQTIDNKVLTSTNKVDIPDWINDIHFKEKIDRQFNLESDSNIINQKHIVASRTDNNLAFVRDIKNSFNDKTLRTYAIVKLSSFLTKKRYAINDTVITDNNISFDVTFDNNPAHYVFSYFIDDGNIKNKKYFTALLNNETNEYAFSQAGLEDSFIDVKENFNKKSSYKVKQANNQFSVMTRYEIVQRCKNSLEKASELINKNLKEGNIVGVGSNEYASYYDMNYLFPDLREDYVPEQVHTAEFVDNTGQSKINEQKTAKRLAFEASKNISKNFNVKEIISQSRTDNAITITAEIVNRDINHVFDFIYNIENEKVASLKEIKNGKDSFSLDELKNFLKNDEKIASYTNNDSSISNKQYIYYASSLKEKLSNFVKNESVDSIIDNMKKSNLIKPLENGRFASKYSLNELLKQSDISYLSDEEMKAVVEQKQRLGNNQKFYQSLTQDNDTRNKIAVYEQQKLVNSIADFIGQYFNDFNLDLLSDEDIVIVFVIDDKPNNIYAKVNYDGDNVSDVICKIGSRRISIKDSKNIFQKSKLLKSYLNDNKETSNYNIIISKAMFHNKLRDYLKPSTIDKIISNLLNKKEMKAIASDKYASQNTFEQLINLCNELPIDGLKEWNLQLEDRTANLKFDSLDIKDNDTRNNIAIASLENYAYEVNNYIKKYVDYFTIDLIDKHNAKLNLCGKNVYASIIYDDGIKDIICDINNRKISISKLNDALKKSELLQSYLEDNKEAKHQGFLITRKAFFNKLEDYISPQEISALIGYLEDNHQIKAIASNQFVSEMSFDELLRNVEIAPNASLKQANLLLKNKLSNYKFDKCDVKDNDNRLIKQTLSVADCKKQILANMPSHIEVKEINDLNIFDDKFSSTLKLFNTQKGLSTIINCTASVSDAKLSNIHFSMNGKELQLDDAFNCNLLTEKNIVSSNKKISNHSIIFTESELKNQLKYLTDDELIVKALNQWEKIGKIQKIASGKFASKYSINELINTSNLKPYTDDVTKQKYSQAAHSKESIPKSFHTNNFEAKLLSTVDDGKTTAVFDEAKEKVMKLAESYLDKQVITSKKLEKIKKLIANVKNPSQLDFIYRDLQRYSL